MNIKGSKYGQIKPRYIPQGSIPIEEPGLGIVYVYPCAGKFGVIAYAGNAGKNSFHYVIKQESHLDKLVSEFFAGLKAHKESVLKYREERSKPHSLKVGDIITNSWGYDQTNVDWYRVSKTTKNFVWLKPISSELMQDEGSSSMSGVESIALDENLKPIDLDKPETKHHASGENVTMRHGCGSKWHGETKYSSWYA